MAILRPFLVVVALQASFRPSAVEIRMIEFNRFDEFGFTHNGILELNISGISLSDYFRNLKLSEGGRSSGARGGGEHGEGGGRRQSRRDWRWGGHQVLEQVPMWMETYNHCQQ
uniref:Uncharacterized protein LOC105048465 n=1 Tax=Elaeis guineensis var. tenera TaxID=51953 RepID=A0A6I9RGA2_ELAGV|nr:uncharacterized protein LOC105048465 [Elaeis guineensis]